MGVETAVVGGTVAAGGGTALLAGGSTAAAIAAANLAAASAAVGATALTATTVGAGVSAGAGLSAAALPGVGATPGVVGFAGAGTSGGLLSATEVATLAPSHVGIFAKTSAFLASPKGLALQAAFTGISTTGQGVAQSREAKAAAEFSDFRARGAVLEGRRKAVVELERVNKEQARQFAAIGASGILPSGSATTSALETGRKGLANVELIQLGAQIDSRAAMLQAENLRRRGRVAILGGFVSGSSRAARLISLGNR